MLELLRKLLGQKILNIYHLVTAVVANLIFGFPSRKLRVIGVTGTDGKTTTVNMIAQILQAEGKNVAFLSTINARVGGKMIDTGLHTTTPSPFFIQRLLRQMVASGAEFAVLEVTSHALDQYRTWGISFETAVLTNVTHEHLDYHKTPENYLSAKLRLLENAAHKKNGALVLNRDDRSYAAASQIPASSVLSFGLSGSAAVWASNLELGLNMAKFTVHAPEGNFAAVLNLPGEFNVKNALAAITVGLHYHVGTSAIQRGLISLRSLPGRMEFLPSEVGFTVVVDFAHTPAGLREALMFLRGQVADRLIVVFGAAGERDRTKRPEMGAVADEKADIVILTREDNRSENVSSICEEIRSGVKNKTPSRDLFIIPDRREAIAFALKLAKKGDLVAVTGKGHEQSLNVDGVETPWNDRNVVTEELGRLSSGK